MTHDKRILTYVAIALIAGAALAVAFALATSGAVGSSATGPNEVTASGISSDAGTEALAAADPAKEQPLLDKFTAKDPFIQFATPGASGTGTSTSSPNPTSSSTPSSNLSAKVKVDGTSFNVMEGDKVPGGSAAAFTITAVTSGDVTFKVIDGALENGDKSFSVNLGESVRVTLESDVSYDISVVSIGQAGSGGGSNGGSSTSSHSISVLSVSSQNGTALVTLEVDGKTYTDLKQGETVSTSFGEIQIVSINVSAQTVTILHGDQTLTLHAGQVIVK